MKLITFAVPCYNSEGYMCKCLDSLLSGGDDVEIIVVNDGSKDRTGDIADGYAARYPSVVRVVNKENGGHGSGVNKGLELATGIYYKVVDSDDWLDADALSVLLNTIRRHVAAGKEPDLYFTNFVYEKIYDNARFVRSYEKSFPKKEFFGWAQVRPFRFSSVLLMHALVYKTDKLRASDTVLPEHTFYVDNIFSYKPLPHAGRLCYLDVDLYRYFIGREDQSVSATNIVRRYTQQIRVMKEMISAYTYAEIGRMPRGLARYMRHALAVAMTLTLMFTTAGTDNVSKRKEDLCELWTFIRGRDRKMYRYLKYRTYPVLVDWMPFHLQGKTTLLGYKYFRKRLKCS